MDTQTDVHFTSGLIKSILVNKPSELLAASKLAVSVAQIVTNIPKRALTIFNNRSENTIRLINTNAELIGLLRQYKDDVNLEAYGPAAAQAQAGTGLILGKQVPIAGIPDVQQQQLMQHCLEQTQNRWRFARLRFWGNSE